MRASVNVRRVVGTKGNAWSNAATGAGGTSTVVDLGGAADVTIMGNTSGASTITIQYSPDGSTFYDHGTTVAANGNFVTNLTVGARWLRLKSSADVTATVTVQAK